LKKELPVSTSSATSSRGVVSPTKSGGAMQTKANSQAVGAVTEEDIKAVLRQSGPIKSHDLVSKFKSRLMTPEVSVKDKQGTLYNYLIIYVGL
jgi:transcription initiation factor TFIIF subunit alpha